MTNYELMKHARNGIERGIEQKCEDIADTWASPDNIAVLKKLLAQYDEIMQEYDAARKEEATD